MIVDQRQEALRRYVTQKHGEWAATPAFGWTHPWDVESLATDLAADARFAEVGLCGFWSGPTAAEVRAVIAPVLGVTSIGPPIDLVSAAVSLACVRHRSQMQKRAAAAGFAVAAVGFVGWLFGRGQG